MGLFSSVKGFVGRGWNVKGWVQAEHIKKEHSFIKSMYKSYLPKKDNDSTDSKSYQQLVDENNYTSSDIARLRNRAKRYCIFYSVFAMALLGYVIYLFTQGAVFAGFCTIPLALVPLACAFKESFFIFCLDKKSFNQNFATWSQQLINRDEEI